MATEKLPLVSTLISTYNGSAYIKGTLFSVLGQTYPNMEIVITDDASGDNTLEIVETFTQENNLSDQVKVIVNQTNQGIARNTNRWLMECRGEYVAILDQDDLRIEPTKIEEQVAFLESHPEYGIVGTQREIVYNGDATFVRLPTTDEEIRKVISRICPLQHSSVMYRKSLAEILQWYDPQYKYAMDSDFFFRILKKSKGHNLDIVSTSYKLHIDNASFLHKKAQKLEVITLRRKHKNEFPLDHKFLLLHTLSLLLPPTVEHHPYLQKVQNALREKAIHD